MLLYVVGSTGFFYWNQRKANARKYFPYILRTICLCRSGNDGARKRRAAPRYIEECAGSFVLFHIGANGVKSKLELGVKSSLRNFINEFYADSLNRVTSEVEQNFGLSNAFNLKENVNAAYAIFSGAYKKFSYKGGVRMEQTNIYGDQEVGNQSFSRHYTDFFPSAFLSQKFKMTKMTSF